MSEIKEIVWNLINSLIAGGLVFLGACSTGKIDTNTFIYAGIASGIVALTQFRSYWMTQENEYSNKRFKKVSAFQFV